MKTVVWFCVFSLIGVAGAQDWAQKVTVAYPAASVPRIVGELAQATSLPIVADPKLAADIVTVKATGVAAREVMDRLAEALDADWVKTEDGLRLERGPAREAQQRAAEREHAVAVMKQRIAKLTAPLDKYPTFDSAAADKLAKDVVVQIQKEMDQEGGDANTYRTRLDLETRTPERRLLAKLLRGLDPAVLAGTERRIVFTTAPTPMQRPLGPSAMQAVAQYVAERRMWSETVVKYPSIEDYGGGDDMEDGPMANFEDPNKPLKKPIAKLFLIVTRYPGDDNFNIQMYMADVEKNIVGRAMLSSNDRAEAYMAMQGQKTPPKLTPLTLSPRSTQIRDFFVQLMERAKKIPEDGEDVPRSRRLPDEILSWFLKPEENEPLGIVATDVVVSLADAAGDNVVAVLGDETATASMQYLYGRRQSGVDEPTFLALSNLVRQRAGGWSIFKPEYPLATRASRAERVSLGKFLRRIAAGVPLLVDEWAAFSKILPSPMENGLMQQWAMLCADEAVASGMYQSSWDFLRIYANFNPVQRAALSRGEAIPFRQFTGGQMALLSSMIYAGDLVLMWQTAPETPGRAGEAAMPTEGFMSELTTEATELLPSGVPQNGFMDCKLSVADAVISDNSRWGGYPLNAEVIAMYRLSKEIPELFGRNGGEMTLPKEFYSATQRTFAFSAHFAPTLNADIQLADIQKSPKAVPYEQLPAAFRKAVEDQMAELRKSWEEMKKNGGGGTTGGDGGGSAPPPLG